MASREPTERMQEAPDLWLYLQTKRLGKPLEGDPIELLLGTTENKIVAEALNRLPDDFRIVATLHYMSDMSYSECSETLQIPIGTIRSRLHRARKMLQIALWDIGKERGYVKEEE